MSLIVWAPVRRVNQSASPVILATMTEHLNENGRFEVSERDKVHIESLLAKVHEAKKQDDTVSHIARERLDELLTADERLVVDRVFAINPSTYGFNGPYVGVEPVPDDLVRVESQPYTEHGQAQQTHVQYVPRPTHDAFTQMAAAMQQDIARTPLIQSSYRSPAYQAIVFLAILKLYEYDAPKTAKRVAVPGYSEHGMPSSLALDLQTVDGSPSDEDPTDFEHTPEYAWLQQHAGRFGFHRSYPRDNAHGGTFEPWHWRYVPASS